MASSDHLTFRLARPADSEAVAALHADSWRRHYRGAYSDSFLDGDVAADRSGVWAERLKGHEPGRWTMLAEDTEGLVGFSHVVFDDDDTWGALLDNLHVTYGQKRRGIGSRLMAHSAEAVLDRPRPTGLYLWVLEQNVDAQAFYGARGGRSADRRPVQAPGGVASRLDGSPFALRYVWDDPAILLG